MKPKSNYPNQEELQARFIYNHGLLYVRKSGRIAGTKLNTGYTHIGYKGNVFLLHRLIYIYHYGDIPEGLVIDHVDGNIENNTIENLQAITQRHNSIKQKLHRNNKTGYRGCTITPSGRYKVQVATGFSDGNRYVGTYVSLNDALKAYNEAALNIFGDLAVLHPV